MDHPQVTEMLEGEVEVMLTLALRGFCGILLLALVEELIEQEFLNS